ncbi:NAD(P)H-dependent oxidoreductase [Halosquirtibacter xylanolyticus]|uniref:NAD(P)H-dependent oxidoreductase n=1 Tax=Halosquirtibacter xylanolyticus TaxID=3374599 RepID=UPI0037487D0F|nr:NAD(P)H-dependent oxidoreductase [Prolixibacteraceae bacterium]
MQKTLIICAHYENQGYLNDIYQQISKTLVSSGHALETITLYKESFDPIRSEYEDKMYKMGIEAPSDVQKYSNLIMHSDQIIILFPLWWNGYPAILKGWIDRIFSPNRLNNPTRITENIKTQVKLIAFYETPWIMEPIKETKEALEITLNQGVWGRMGYHTMPIIWIEDQRELSKEKVEDRLNRIIHKVQLDSQEDQ